MGTMIDVAEHAPDFVLPGTDPEIDAPTVREYRLSDHLDGPVILTFYLFDFNPNCVEHLCSLRNVGWFELLEGATVFAVSTDRTYSHRAFAEEHDLDFILLSDSDGSVSEAYGVRYDEFNHHKGVAKRSVFVIDESRTVRYAWSTEDPAETPDWSAVLDAAEPLAAGAGGGDPNPSR